MGTRTKVCKQYTQIFTYFSNDSKRECTNKCGF